MSEVIVTFYYANQVTRSGPSTDKEKYIEMKDRNEREKYETYFLSFAFFISVREEQTFLRINSKFVTLFCQVAASTRIYCLYSPIDIDECHKHGKTKCTEIPYVSNNLLTLEFIIRRDIRR
jgi:hypothetical protein